MKKIYTLLIGVFLCSSSANAIEILDVKPGDGTLNEAIKQYKGDRIYRLQDGYNGYYSLTEIIDNSGFDLTIVGGGTPDVNDPRPDMPPTVQTNGVNGVPFNFMFNVYSDITLQGIYFVNATVDGVFNTEFFMGIQGHDVVVTIDDCVLDPSGNPFYVIGNSPQIYVTNSLFNRLTTQTTSVNGPVNCYFPNKTHGPEVLYFENNTFVGLSTAVFSDNCESVKSGLAWFNHNTFIHHKCQFDWMSNQEEFYFVNNLFYDCQVVPTEVPDKPYDAAQAQWTNYPIGAVPEFLLSAPDSRVKDKGVDVDWGYDKMTSFVAYNVDFKNKSFIDNLDKLNQWLVEKGTGKQMYYMPFVWDENSPARGIDLNFALERNPQHEIYNSAQYPQWKHVGSAYDINPQFSDKRIDEKSGILAKWALPATKNDYYKPFYDGDTDFMKLDWYWDPDGDLGKNETWPLFDGSYTNVELKTYGIDGLPVGDLTWFPEQKAVWEANRDRIKSHIKGLQTERLDLSSVESVETVECRVYPNPAAAQVNFLLDTPAVGNGEMEIFNMIGQKVLDANLQEGDTKLSLNISGLVAGVYSYRLSSGRTVIVGRFVKK